MPSLLQKISRRILSRWGANRLSDFGQRNRITTTAAVFKKCRIQFFGDDNLIAIAPGAAVTQLEITIIGSRNQIYIGANVVYLKGNIWCSSDDGRIRIGEQTTISEASLTLTEPGMSITLGRDCLLSWNISLRCGDGHPIVDLSTGETINPARPIALGDHVWVAAHVEVLKGVSIGEHSVIGAHSVVTHDVPAHAVAAGVPARVLRENISWHRDAKVSGAPPSLNRP
jgi:acetyltransferase-like isoleucine patch superfamily enzyme